MHLEVNGTIRKERGKMGEVLECDVIVGSLQGLDAWDRKEWRLGCKKQLTSACGEPLLCSRNRKKHIPGAKC